MADKKHLQHYADQLQIDFTILKKDILTESDVNTVVNAIVSGLDDAELHTCWKRELDPLKMLLEKREAQIKLGLFQRIADYESTSTIGEMGRYFADR